jgi:hypothetical protein
MTEMNFEYKKHMDIREEIDILEKQVKELKNQTEHIEWVMYGLSMACLWHVYFLCLRLEDTVSEEQHMTIRFIANVILFVICLLSIFILRFIYLLCGQ